MKVDDASKAELKRQGRWSEFLARRTALKKDGMGYADACRAALLEFLPDGVPADAEGEDPPAGSKPDPRDNLDDDVLARLAGKKSKPTELIQWVAANIAGTPDFETCPGMDALSLLFDCQRFPAFRLDFWKSMYTKMIPNRSVFTDDEDPSDVDGSQTMAVLRKIAGISKAAKASVDQGGAE